MKNSGLRTFAIGFIFAWIGIMVVIPTLMVVITSFLTSDSDHFVATPLTLAAYVEMFNPITFSLLLKSFNIAVMSSIMCLMLGYPFAYIVARSPKSVQPILLMLIIVPFWTNSLIRNYALISILSASGFVNSTLLAWGLIDKPLEILYTDVSVFIGMVYTLLPFMILPLYASIEKLDRSMIEAAQDLGATWKQRFIHVIFPLTMPGIIAGTIMVFLPSLSMFYISDILGGADSMVLGSLIKIKFMTAKDWPLGSAIGVLLMIVMFAMIWAYRKSSKFTGTGKKGDLLLNA